MWQCWLIMPPFTASASAKHLTPFTAMHQGLSIGARAGVLAPVQSGSIRWDSHVIGWDRSRDLDIGPWLVSAKRAKVGTKDASILPCGDSHRIKVRLFVSRFISACFACSSLGFHLWESRTTQKKKPKLPRREIMRQSKECIQSINIEIEQAYSLKLNH